MKNRKFLKVIIFVTVFAMSVLAVGMFASADAPANGVLVLDAQSQTGTLDLHYDDRYEFSAEYTVGSLSDVNITSYNVNGSKDANLLTFISGKKYVATAVGTGKLSVTKGGVDYSVSVSVTPATLNIMFITGHSVSSGSTGNPAKSILL